MTITERCSSSEPLQFVQLRPLPLGQLSLAKTGVEAKR